MTDHEMLMELLEYKRKVEQRRKIELIVRIVLIVILAVCLTVAWVKISATMREVHENMAKINAVTEKIQGFSDSLRSAGVEKPEEAVKSLIETSQKLNKLLDRIGEDGMQRLEQGLEAVDGARDWLTGLFGDRGA